MTATRRLAAIMAIDAVGGSRLHWERTRSVRPGGEIASRRAPWTIMRPSRTAGFPPKRLLEGSLPAFEQSGVGP
jgi:hypothetical protein